MIGRVVTLEVFVVLTQELAHIVIIEPHPDHLSHILVVLRSLDAVNISSNTITDLSNI